MCLFDKTQVILFLCDARRRDKHTHKKGLNPWRGKSLTSVDVDDLSGGPATVRAAGGGGGHLPADETSQMLEGSARQIRCV